MVYPCVLDVAEKDLRDIQLSGCRITELVNQKLEISSWFEACQSNNAYRIKQLLGLPVQSKKCLITLVQPDDSFSVPCSISRAQETSFLVPRTILLGFVGNLPWIKNIERVGNHSVAHIKLFTPPSVLVVQIRASSCHVGRVFVYACLSDTSDNTILNATHCEPDNFDLDILAHPPIQPLLAASDPPLVTL